MIASQVLGDCLRTGLNETGTETVGWQPSAAPSGPASVDAVLQPDVHDPLHRSDGATGSERDRKRVITFE
jgi:hypothetical protein